jgi:hypothetical protein
MGSSLENVLQLIHSHSMTSKKMLKLIVCSVSLIKSGYLSFSVQNSAISVPFMRELIVLILNDLG